LEKVVCFPAILKSFWRNKNHFFWTKRDLFVLNRKTKVTGNRRKFSKLKETYKVELGMWFEAWAF
jgi:hypothetical protein